MKFLQSKEVKNAGWLLGGRIVQMILSFFVGILSARYLGATNFGLISYCSSYVTFFTSFCTLGINSVIVKELVDNPNEQGEAIGSTIILRFLSSLLSGIMIVGIVLVVDKGEPLTFVISILCSVALLFQVFDSINYWFQSRYQSKITAISTLIAYIIVSGYRIILLCLKKDIRWFAFASSVDYIVVAIFLLWAYHKNGGPKLKFSIQKSKSLLKSSYHYILSGMMVAIYSQTDKLMLKHFLDETEVGYYTIAVTISTMWVFVLTAVIDSMYPTIVRLNKENKQMFEEKNRQLYAIVFWVSCFVSLFLVAFGDKVVLLLYGTEYSQSILPLKIITWYVAFSYLGVARNAWIVCTNNQKYLKYTYFAAAVMNVILNWIMIPTMHASGAALASLITQIFTSIILPFLIPSIRANAVLMLDAITFRKLGIRR